jgi:DNA-directed RNA polymerase subunit RPC12/RpoP
MAIKIEWHGLQDLGPQRYRCWYCGESVAAIKGLHGSFAGKNQGAYLVACPNCGYPTLLRFEQPQVPSPRSGSDVAGIDDKSVLDLYNEARGCTAAGAYTACLLCCRKILMHLAVAKGAAEGLNFAGYVDYLTKQGYVPPDGKEWVDHIRTVGNEANHEIMLATKDLAEEILSFAEMLLKFIYEFPHRVRSRTRTTSTEDGT